MKTAFTHERWPQGAHVSSQILWTQKSFIAGTETHPNASGSITRSWRTPAR